MDGFPNDNEEEFTETDGVKKIGFVTKRLKAVKFWKIFWITEEYMDIDSNI